MVMTKYISGNELIARWDIEAFELYQMVWFGYILPFDDTGQEVYYPGQRAKLKTLNDMEQKLSLLRDGIKNQEDKANREEIKKLEEEIFEYEQSFFDPENYDGWGTSIRDKSYDERKKIISIIENSLYLKFIVEAIEDDEQIVNFKNLKVQTRKVPKSTSKKLESEKILSDNRELIAVIGKEAEEIYEHIIKTIGATDKSMQSRTERRNSALEYYRNNEDKFDSIEETHLEDLDIFDFNSNQSKRDYMTRLLKTVLEDIFPDNIFSGTKIFNFYKSTSRQESTNSTEDLINEIISEPFKVRPRKM